ncbi:MAG: hypothetical protein ACOZNI_19570 [Myxococcota bacterium]
MMLALVLAACAPHPATPATPPPAAEAEAFAPHVHTLEELRAAFPQGTRVRLAIAIPGQPEMEQRWQFVAVDAETCTIASQVYTPAGELVQDEGQGTSTWAELYTHADFPASKTTREESSVDVPAGHFDTWLYTVRKAGEDGVPELHRYHFAKTLPGPPVLYTAEREGKEIFRMTLLERTPR